MKRNTPFFILLSLLVCLVGCNKDPQPTPPDSPVTLLSTTERNNSNGRVVEACYSDSTRWYFRLLSDSTAEVTSYRLFYDDGDDSQAWVYRGEVTIPEQFEHQGTTYKVNAIGSYAFGAYLETMTNTWYAPSLVTAVTIPNTVTSIQECAFLACASLESVNIPNTVLSIPNNCFADCQKLQSVTLPNTLLSIGDQAFVDCLSLVSFEIPESVCQLGFALFEGCTALKTLTCRPTTPPGKYEGWYYEGPFLFPESLESIAVPSAALDAYKNDANWSPYAGLMVGIN